MSEPPPATMTLPELCEPFFQYICMVNRVARTPSGPELDYVALRDTVQLSFNRMKENSKDDPRLSAQLKKMEMPLMFFVDSMIAESKLPIAAQWHKNRLAYERDELAGDEKFFDLLDESLAEAGSEANERLMIYYTCLGLGFTGWYAGQPEYLRKKMLAIAQRIGGEIDRDQTARLTPEAYDHLDTRDLVQPPGWKLATLAIIFTGLFLTVLTVNFYLFRDASQSLTDSLRKILPHDLTPPK
jgi:type IV/VI secretion system ImpK/VasF family protein